MLRSMYQKLMLLAVAVGSLIPQCVLAEGAMLLREVCRLKGQEIHTLQGLGLVVGLKGTGDSDAQPTARALSRMMQLMGGQMSVDPLGNLMTKDVKDAKNTALVFITAHVPAVGGQQGDRLDCTVNAISAKSLEGGTLMMSPLLGPRADQPTVYAIAEGPLTMSTDTVPTTATIASGAKMQTSILAPFEKDGRVVLVLERDFAGFDIAQTIEDAINNLPENSLLEGSSSSRESNTAKVTRARAIDSLHIEVNIPEIYLDKPIKFLSYVLKTPVDLPHNRTRVVINEREGVVIIGEEVRIAPVLITHQNLRIEATQQNGFVSVDPGEDPDAKNPKLKALADALNALDVPTQDLIAIIKSLKRKGDLYGEVIFQ
jgi:flagellar P-ring protein FlgI